MPPIFRIMLLTGLALVLAIGTVFTIDAVREEIGIAREFFAADVGDCTQTYRDDGVVRVEGHEIEVEIARAQWERQRGLSGRDCIQRGQGMLFVFEEADYHSFWMKDMKFPIDIIWIHDDIVVHVADDMQPPSAATVIPATHVPPVKANMVLELGSGEAERLGISPRSSFELSTER